MATVTDRVVEMIRSGLSGAALLDEVSELLNDNELLLTHRVIREAREQIAKDIEIENQIRSLIAR